MKITKIKLRNEGKKIFISNAFIIACVGILFSGIGINNVIELQKAEKNINFEPWIFVFVGFGIFIFAIYNLFSLHYLIIDEIKRTVLKKKINLLGRKNREYSFKEFNEVKIKKVVSHSKNKRQVYSYLVSLKGSIVNLKLDSFFKYSDTRQFAELICKKMKIDLLDKSGETQEKIRKYQDLDLSVKQKLQTETTSILQKPPYSKVKLETENHKIVIKISIKGLAEKFFPLLYFAVFIYFSSVIYFNMLWESVPIKNIQDITKIFEFQNRTDFVFIGWFAMALFLFFNIIIGKKEKVILEKGKLTIIKTKFLPKIKKITTEEIEEISTFTPERLDKLDKMYNRESKSKFLFSIVSFLSLFLSSERRIKIISDKESQNVFSGLKKEELLYIESVLKNHLKKY